MVAQCWNCGAEAPVRFCGQCKAIQPPERDYFAFFEIPRHLAIDEKDLERRYYALSRQLHPDLFSRRSQRENSVFSAIKSLIPNL